MGVDYIPRRDGRFAAWLQVLLEGVAQVEPKLEARRREPLAELRPAIEDFVRCLAEHDALQNQARAARTAKDASRRICERTVRRVVRHLQSTPGITDADRAAMAIRVPKKGRLSRAAADRPPETAPLLRIQSRGPTHLLHFTDEKTPTRKAKPARVRACQIDRAIVPAGEKCPPMGSDAWKYLDQFTATPAVLHYEPKQAGMRIWYRARWTNTHFRPGPWGAKVCALVGD